jgi:hypothetical protein
MQRSRILYGGYFLDDFNAARIDPFVRSYERKWHGDVVRSD